MIIIIINEGDDRGDDDDNKRGAKILNDSITILNEIKKQIFQIMCRFIVIILLIVIMGKG